MLSSIRGLAEPQVTGQGELGPAHRPSTPVRGWTPGEVHLWVAATDDRDDASSNLAVLDDVERARAARLRFERDRVRFIHSHAFTRRVLGHYLGLHPAAVRISTTASGKPQLDPVHGISFSTSRDHDLATVAVAPGVAVGVDVEWLRPIEDAMEVSRQHFAKVENDWLRSVPQENRSRSFLALWTSKESFVKALGGGLSIPLGSFVMLANEGGSTGQASGTLGALPYVFAQFDAPGGYIGAVTTAGSRVVIRHMDSPRDL